jgi:hypothetical protein
MATLSFLITVPAYFASGVFDRAEPEILSRGSGHLSIAAICFRREWSQALNTALAAIFVLINFASWLSGLKNSSGGCGRAGIVSSHSLNNTPLRR